MKIDFKITTWERVDIADETFEVMKPLLENGTITNSNDLIEWCSSNNYYYGFEGTIAEVEEQMTVEDNGGCATIEVINDEKNSIWTNEHVKS